ncbi:MAG: DoxX family protein [Gammaproteobacteria bacterium]|nr:DoxX family protein [Gammaproteobacteria bacterium]MBT8152121.1 DoxX family protein [Gammaproteobacteria bacterium]NND40266.1 DoxX family protein [Pseudomonadales bacterium]NNM12528.1 DoxX family protein [Pseudomonadales bacterium]
MVSSLYQHLRLKLQWMDFLPLLLLRIFLAPIFIQAGYGKLQLGSEANIGLLQRLQANPDVVNWFGNAEWGLGLPQPELLALLAGWGEFIGGWLLVFGLLTRLSSALLIVTMAVAASTAHWENGWHALPEAKLTVPWEWRVDLIDAANERKAAAQQLLKRHGNYAWLTEVGSFTVLKNGIEFAATYALMLLVLLCFGAGRFFSVDYWISRRMQPANST